MKGAKIMRAIKYAIHCGNNERRTDSGTGSDIITTYNFIISFCSKNTRNFLIHFNERNNTSEQNDEN